MEKHLLIFSWEYYGFHSAQGAAVSKRPRQVAKSFIKNGWNVTVIHKDHKNECKENRYLIHSENGVKRIAVKESKQTQLNKNVFLRKVETLYYTIFRGDRSFNWAQDVIYNFPEFKIDSPSLIISFFTPRVTLSLGDYFSKKLRAPWIADLQDPVYEGISKESLYLAGQWMKRTLKSARSIIQVSPEWAESDSKILGRAVSTIRHAVIESSLQPAKDASPSDVFKIFYGGSINPGFQSLDLLKKVIASIQSDTKIQICLAGNAIARDYFKKALGDEMINYLGWLSFDEMHQCISNCNCTLVIACSKDRICIPSKFYELCAYEKPVWIIGDDIGAFGSLLEEWKHPGIGIDNFEYQIRALTAAMKGDYQYMFNITNCHAKYITATDLYKEYIKLTW